MLLGMLPVSAMADATDETFQSADSTVSYYGRDLLSAMDNSAGLLYAYDQLATGVEKSAEAISVYNGTDAISQAEIEMVMDLYRKDYAHHFWLGNGYRFSSNSFSVVTIKPTYTMKGQELEAAKATFEQKVTDILSGITSAMSEYEKELYLHDRLAGMVTYTGGTNAHNAYGALVEGKAVCGGYAESLQYLLQRVGIQSFLVEGTSIDPATMRPENHEWNYVRIDGKYYHVDLTWDDQGERLFHAYFNQTDAVIQEDHTIFETEYPRPVCNATAAQYFTGKAEYLDSYTADRLGQLLKDNGLKVHVYIPGNMNGFLSWYTMNILNIAQKAGVNGGFSWGYAKLGNELILSLSTGCNHTSLTLRPARDAACTADGCKAYYVCTCGMFFEDAAASVEIADFAAWKTGAGRIPMKGHNYSQQLKDAAHLKRKAADCTEYNVYWYDCAACGANAKDDADAADKFYTSTEAGGHKFDEKLVDAAHLVAGTGTNCQSARKYYYDCAYCAEIGPDSWTSDTYGDHDFSEKIADAAHLAEGNKYYYDCAHCTQIGTDTWTKPETPVVPVPSFSDVSEDTYYYGAVDWAVKNGITTGTSATSFSPDMTCTRGQIVTVLWRAAGQPEPNSYANAFQDLSPDTFCYKAVLWAVENGITTGLSATSFGPDAPCTRAQVATFLWRSQEAPAVSAGNPFADVTQAAYYFNAVLWAVENSVTTGTSATTFSPDADCTRAQIVTFLYRSLGDR